ncbi:uncharacterized protein EV422DRAFT_609426 [Fimicolochytrium jonesii]|uniref:uncharacterized protein n=1 Tax=Fimicolochytrium jonesii TaxID=1396493 RepID=UPI0022FE3879|nr:uncharacterized protein EV422DRAFT_609426 [Fimicolochytrium jonesii]KAI8824325.1 hypothetical protein EV422DRAFT_609426 [Fimicolochytrium jonesii]
MGFLSPPIQYMPEVTQTSDSAKMLPYACAHTNAGKQQPAATASRPHPNNLRGAAELSMDSWCSLCCGEKEGETKYIPADDTCCIVNNFACVLGRDQVSAQQTGVHWVYDARATFGSFATSGYSASRARWTMFGCNRVQRKIAIEASGGETAPGAAPRGMYRGLGYKTHVRGYGGVGSSSEESKDRKRPRVRKTSTGSKGRRNRRL